MAWAEHSRQPLLFLKLDNSKAYDMVEWGLFFKTILAMGFPPKFVEMVKLLYREANASVKVNGASSLTFKIKRGVG